MAYDIGEYIKEARAKGMSDDAIKSILLSMGTPPEQVNSAFTTPQSVPVSQPPISSASQVPQQPPNSPLPQISQQPPTSGIPPISSSPVISLGGTADDTFINRWSWGGFFLYFFYFLGGRLYAKAFLYLLGTAVPILNIWLWIKSGLRGRKMVWESGKWNDFEEYKKRQKLLDKIGIWLFAASILLLLAYGVFAAISIKNALNNVPAGSDNITTSSSQSIAPTATSSASSSNIAQTQPATSSIKDCGSMSNDRFVEAFYSNQGFAFTASERTTLQCFDQAVLNCSPATFTTLSKSGNVVTKVNGFENTKCSISGESGQYTTKCAVPTNFLTYIKAKASNQVGGVTNAIGLIFFAPDQLKDDQGNSFAITCSKS